jgi:hypothetical protein
MNASASSLRSRTTPAPAAASRSSAQNDVSVPRRRWITPTRIGFLLAAAAIYLGAKGHTERYISPEYGVGYALGILGGSAMLLLLLYPARKRLKWIGFLGSVKSWFQAHMILGVVGPVLILFHSNFSLGATNSNAALVSMLIVAGSGIFGRYFYTRIHHGLYGRRSSRADLQAAAAELRDKVAGSQFVPQLLEQLDAADARLLGKSGKLPPLLWRPIRVTLQVWIERRKLTRTATRELRAAARTNAILAQQYPVFLKATKRYIGKRLDAARRVAEFESYERLFALWHMFHLPLFFILLVAGIIHVIAVHIY